MFTICTKFAQRFAVRRHIAAACVAVSVTSPAVAMPDTDAIVPKGVQSERCDVHQEWSLNYLANLLYLDIDALARVKLVRGLSGVDLCTMPESRLSRAIVKAAESFELATRYNLSAYDAAYLWLAAKLKAPLATFDAKLGEAARAHLASLT